ncbi:C4b-binding protein alpha chain [Sorex araneus]|uniref:C4b-binding protein alpha chain n=1 Tax=Sorex araneus TaxID=42254 RepID=UPI002433ECAE|nr:C4b-binding protein alpha chain [Sorex araneus]
MSWRRRAVRPPRAARGSLHPARATVTCSFPGPALLRMTWVAALFTTALGDCGPPPILTFAAPMTELNRTDFESGTVLKYVCRPGYIKTGSNQFLTCEDSGAWRDSINCVKRRCRHPGELRNGHVIVQTDFAFGSEISFSCLEGYILIGPETSFCEVQGRGVEWSEPLPECIVAQCAPPPAISNGRHSGKDKEFYPYGSSVTYSCDPQFSLVGKASISCSMENKTQTVWIPSPPTCQRVTCPHPEVRHGKLMAGFRSTFHYKDSLEFDCGEGFQLVGSRVIHCAANGQWSPPPPVCEQKACCPKPVLKGGEVLYPRRHSSVQMCAYFYGDTISYRCYGKDNHESRCQRDGTWSPEPTCENSCYFPPDIAHGSYRKVRNFLTEEVHYTCTSGYKLVGPSKLTCSREGWSEQAPRCKAVCLRPKIEHGQLSENNSQYLEPASVTVHCDSGYRLVGNQTITCSEDRTWSPAVPRCEWEFPAGCEPVAKGWKLMQCLPDPREAKLAQEMYKLSLEIQLLEQQIEQVRTNMLQPPELCRCQEDPDHLHSSDPAQSQYGPTLPPELYCRPFPAIAHGSRQDMSSFFSFTTVVRYECDEGYLLVGEPKISCRNSHWSAPAPRCRALCAKPHIAHGHLSVEKHQYVEWENVTVHCDPGYDMVGPQTISCSDNRMWDPEVPRCEWEVHTGCEPVAAGRRLMQCLPSPEDVKLALELYRLSLEIKAWGKREPLGGDS